MLNNHPRFPYVVTVTRRCSYLLNPVAFLPVSDVATAQYNRSYLLDRGRMRSLAATEQAGELILGGFLQGRLLG